MIRVLNSGQPLFAESEDEIGSSSPAKVLLAGADGQTLKSAKKEAPPCINRMVPL